MTYLQHEEVLKFVDSYQRFRCAGIELFDSVKERLMNSYRVTFYKQIQNSTGHSFRCAQSSFDIVAADPTEAVNSACQQLVKNHRVNDWKKLVDSFEVERTAPEGVHA